MSNRIEVTNTMGDGGGFLFVQDDTIFWQSNTQHVADCFYLYDIFGEFRLLINTENILKLKKVFIEPFLK